MQLVGGILIDGVLRRDAALSPLTGDIELLLAEIAQAPLGQSERVSRFLDATLAGIGGRPVAAGALSVPDRQHLVREVGAAMGFDRVWLTSTCGACDAGFDLAVVQSSLPVKAAAMDYPSRTLNLRGLPITLRAPTGDDQAIVEALPEDEAMLTLLDRLIGGEGRPAAADLTAAEVAQLEAALEAMMPEVAVEAQATCPECGAANRVEVDPYLTLGTAGDEIFEEVNTLARFYHWAEAEILSLPRERRRRYLRLIDRSNGMISADNSHPGDWR